MIKLWAAADKMRGHTMYHRNSAGAISYSEFRHLGKEGVLGKYPVHFHLLRDGMRGTGEIDITRPRNSAGE